MQPSERMRVALTLRGVVQGVGMRPAVHVLAERFGLAGFVRNEVSRVVVELEGDAQAIDAFVAELRAKPPPLARIDEWQAEPREPAGYDRFRIEPSAGVAGESPIIAADTATCPDCLAEVFDPDDRRHAHPFANCTACGPRLTIVTGAPYDRAKTTMAKFPLCPECRAEYESPADRRFHAQPVACPSCGPRLSLVGSNGVPLPVADPLLATVMRLIAGEIAAIKGVGGYHLACDATNPAAVQELRRRKRRDAKPFALLVRDLDQARELAEIGAAECALLSDRAAPIVLVRRRSDARLGTAIAPGLDRLGVMLPPTPLHHLLARRVDRPLVLTSGNLSEEPMVFDDREAIERLGAIADFVLTHDRPIHLRCDDSVMRVMAGFAVPLRRSRGYAPLPLRLPAPLARPTLALGGHLKNTFALGMVDRATLSPHIGDLDELSAYEALVETIEHYQHLFGVSPERVVHDTHPDYASTRLARELSRAGLSSLAVQHHHAHVAACIAEHQLSGPVIGVAFDGSGLGDDGTLWGGEFLVGTAESVERMAHLAPVPLPGGDRAARQGHRMAIVHARRAGIDPLHTAIAGHVAERDVAAIERIAESDHAPLTSSAGRLFDAVAALAGVAFESRFEGDAAMQLEACAERGMALTSGGYELSIETSARGIVLEPRPLIAAVVSDAQSGVGAEIIAARFHRGLAAAVRRIAQQIRDIDGVSQVVLSGGVFCNALLTELALVELEAAGFQVHVHCAVPPNDGGLSFGQLAVAAARDGAT